MDGAPMSREHVVAVGGGGFSMEESPVLDDYVLGLARQERPQICFLPTASGDNENYITRFYTLSQRRGYGKRNGPPVPPLQRPELRPTAERQWRRAGEKTNE
jgi:hypothetical protein